MSIHLLSRGLLKASAGGGGGGYTQNLVDTQGSAYSTTLTFGVSDAATFTMSMWLNFNTTSGTHTLLEVSGRTWIRVAGGVLFVFLKGNDNTVFYNSNSSAAAFTAGVQAHLCIEADIGNGTLSIKIDGADVTMDTDPATVSSGAYAFDFDRTMYIGGDGANDLDAVVADWIIDDSIISASTLYNGGTPPDPESAIATPLMLLGGSSDYTDWNSGTNLGSGGSLTVNNTYAAG